MLHHSRRASALENQSRQKRRKLLLMAVHLIAAAALIVCFLIVRPGAVSGDLRSQLIASCKQSVSDGIKESNAISSIGGAAAYPRLALVRQYVYYIDQINQICVTTQGVRLAQDDVIAALYQALHDYTSSVQSGSSTTAAQNALSKQLATLQEQLSQVR